jgi:hypothetical protein
MRWIEAWGVNDGRRIERDHRQSNKIGNTVSSNNELRKLHNPVNVPSVHRFDEARTEGARRLERKEAESISLEPIEILPGKAKVPGSLK